ncbi:hypothetical protein [Nitratireductor luteus]|uniref:hypothetical protein n=1 Tax=Nitratireductor luteus TaxID=2976980 RepID=UPI00223F4BC1|nr:hypothetical protein [Nitratireductor luteus]
MKQIPYLLAATVATPAVAHEITADHTHVGETVLFHMSPLLALGAGIAALAVFVVLRTRGTRKMEEDRHDPR